MTWIDGLIDGLMDFVSVLRCLIHAHDVCERPRPSLPLTRGKRRNEDYLGVGE